MRLDIDPRYLEKIDEKRIEKLREQVTGIKKTAFDYKTTIKLRSTINKARDKVKHLENQDEVDPRKAIELVGNIRGTKSQFKKHIQSQKDWNTLNTLKSLEQRLINLRRNG